VITHASSSAAAKWVSEVGHGHGALAGHSAADQFDVSVRIIPLGQYPKGLNRDEGLRAVSEGKKSNGRC